MRLVQVNNEVYIIGCDGCSYYDSFYRKCLLYGYEFKGKSFRFQFCPSRNHLSRSKYQKVWPTMKRILGGKMNG